MPLPMRVPESCLINTGAGTWKKAALKPITNKSNDKIIKFGATPNKLIEIAVIAGVRIIKYRIGALSAIRPINGLKSEGIRWKIVSKPAIEYERLNFSINRGRIGAKKDE